jgi:signal transduction histidine kinase
LKDSAKTKKQLIAELEVLYQENTKLRHQVKKGGVLAIERQLAAERIRAEVMAMRSSDDLHNVVVNLWRQVLTLGIETPMVNVQFIDLSKIEAGRIDIKPEAVDLKQLATECIVSVESLVKSGVQLKPQLADVSPVHTDADRIRRVVMNLLSNALKFTEQGSIAVSAKPVDGWIELSVADTGSGIPPEDLPHIFDEFRQVESEGRKTQEGTGLGLSIAKRSVELLGGTISVESEIGKGTKFTLRITDYGA